MGVSIDALWERLVPLAVRQRLAPWWVVAQRLRRSAGRYRRLLFADLATFVLTSLLVIPLYAGVLYGSRFWWAVFRETPVGQGFFGFFLERASFIEAFLEQPLWVLTLKVYVATVVAGLAVGVVGQFLLAKRYVYDSAGCPTRLVVWGGPTLLGTSLWAADAFAVDLQTALIICALPVLGMFAQCLGLAARLCPEATTVGRLVTRSGPWRRLVKRWPWWR